MVLLKKYKVTGDVEHLVKYFNSKDWERAIILAQRALKESVTEVNLDFINEKSTFYFGIDIKYVDSDGWDYSVRIIITERDAVYAINELLTYLT